MDQKRLSRAVACEVNLKKQVPFELGNRYMERAFLTMEIEGRSRE